MCYGVWEKPCCWCYFLKALIMIVLGKAGNCCCREILGGYGVFCYVGFCLVIEFFCK